MIRLWEENLGEPWHDYSNATKFVQYDKEGNIIAGFAVYWDDSDGIGGHFISGWSARKNTKSVLHVIKYLADKLGEIYIKTEKRHMKIISEKIGEKVKNAGRFAYYIVRGNKNG